MPGTDPRGWLLDKSALARSPHPAGVTDLLIAATAQQHDLVVLHYDRDFETLGRLCGVKEQAIVPLGSIN